MERFAGLNDDQEYVIPVHNPETGKTVKGIKITGLELQFLSTILTEMIQQRITIDNIAGLDKIKREQQVKIDAPPDEGANPLQEKKGDFGGYEETMMRQVRDSDPTSNKPQKAITENPSNVKPPRLP